MPFAHQPLEAVPDLPGVVTSFELRQMHLGIVYELGILCCLDCDPLTLLNLETCTSHIHKHVFNPRAFPRSKVMETCTNYRVYGGMLDEYPRPNQVVPPYRFLPTRDATSCTICESNRTPYFGTSESARRRHFNKMHTNRINSREVYERPCTIQTFCSGYSDNRHAFEVDPALMPNQDLEQPFVTHDAVAEDMMRAFVKDFKPAEQPHTSGDSLKDTQPFLYFTRWHSHTTPHSPEFLIPLAAFPESGEIYHTLAEKAVELFRDEQLNLEGRSEILRSKMMQEEEQPVRKTLKRLDPTTVDEYARTFGRWCVFVLRLYTLQKSGNDRYRSACERALKYCRREPDRHGSRYVILRLAQEFWAPANMTDFSHLELDQFDDPTLRFAVILNLYDDGTFASPSNATHRLSVMKYTMRFMLLVWAADRQLELVKEVPDVTLGSIPLHVYPFLSRQSHTPFAHVCVASSHATHYSSTMLSMPKINWTGPSTVSIDGQILDFTDYQRSVLELLEQTERRILDDLLRGLTPESLGFNITEDTAINDRFGDTSRGYSFLGDYSNPFSGMQMNLISGFLHRRNHFLVSGMYRDQDGELHITWNEKEVEEWLNCYDECIKELSLVITMAGGQPARGVETCLMKLINLIGRTRATYYYKPGIIVFVLMYSKTTSMTGYDRLVAHAVPWRIGRLFLIVISLARPLSGILVERIKGPLGRAIQETSVFPLHGVEMTSKILSDLIKDFFRRNFGVNIGILNFRHLIIAFQRRKMAEAFAPIQRMIAVVDAQAGHSSETAMEHYALDPSEMHMFTTSTVLKHVTCLLRWCQILFPTDILTAQENLLAGGASDNAAIVNDVSSSSTSHVVIPEEQMVRTFVQAVESSNLVQQLTDQFTRSLTGVLATRTAQQSQSTIPPAGPIAVQPRYLIMLQQYTSNAAASWTCSAQAKAVSHILGRATSLVVVLPTSAGKSLLFGCLPLLEAGLTVIIFPLRALMTDQIAASEKRQEELVRSGEAYGRDVRIQPLGRNVNEPGLYAISAETTETSWFKSWVDEQIYARKLNRVVINEAHMVVTTASYREVMKEFGYLSGKRIPIVCLTGTLPPRLEPSLCEALGGASFRIIREPTQRPNIAYHIATFGSQSEAEFALISHVRRYETELSAREGILVMCRSWSDVERVAGSLEALKYSRQVSMEEADLNLSYWLNGTRKTIVGTTALGTGIHHPACCAVLHFGPPYGLVDFVQESGRAGRDGKSALSVVFTWEMTVNITRNDPNCWAAMKEMMENDECIRWWMSREIDGEDLATTCSGGQGFLACGRCVEELRRAREHKGLWLAGVDEAERRSKRKYHAESWVVEHLPGYGSNLERMEVDGPQEGWEEMFRVEEVDNMDVSMSESIEAGRSGMCAMPPMVAPAATVGPTIIADAHMAQERGRQARLVEENRAGAPVGSLSLSCSL
ncbi:ATP-dependent DNA helicase tlh1 [Ceratobasidium theobromae]|uniref:DNA 3'-5' helicase n=1 Tax=Ceratobasidium theobromae TaxID=1582974 RepID=A0A5N5QAL5_9AGAM|nr:ATP-dependent DNA helicase tlh1 [Ceratobasidium theobromae]